MIFENNFDNLSEKDVALLDAYFNGCDYQSSSHTFIANYIWRNTHNITWQIIGTYLFIAGMGTTETQEEEYIYYSDLFYGYSTYLTSNTYLISYELDTSNVTTNVLNEYINTDHFKTSVWFEALFCGSKALQAKAKSFHLQISPVPAGQKEPFKGRMQKQ